MKDDLPNAKKAQRKQARERQYLPRVWPLLLALAVIIVVAILLKH